MTEPTYVADLEFRVPVGKKERLIIARGSEVQVGPNYLILNENRFSVESTACLIRDRWLIPKSEFVLNKKERVPMEQVGARVWDERKSVMQTVILPIEYDRAVDFSVNSDNLLRPVPTVGMNLDKWIDASDLEKLSYISSGTPDLDFLKKALKIERKKKVKLAIRDLLATHS